MAAAVGVDSSGRGLLGEGAAGQASGRLTPRAAPMRLPVPRGCVLKQNSAGTRTFPNPLERVTVAEWSPLQGRRVLHALKLETLRLADSMRAICRRCAGRSWEVWVLTPFPTRQQRKADPPKRRFI